MDWPLTKTGKRMTRVQMRYGITRMQTPDEMEDYISSPDFVPLSQLSDEALIAMYRQAKHNSVSRRAR